MKKSLCLQAVFIASVLAACNNGDKAAKVQPADNQVAVDITPITPAVESQAVIVSRIVQTSSNKKEALMADSKLLVSTYGDTAARDVSNGLWAGNNGFERNRPASGALAVAANDASPQGWSALRAGIAYVNGLGVDQDGAAAIRILSGAALAENTGAQYFLAKAYELDGQADAARAQLQKAADMGHALAKKELEG